VMRAAQALAGYTLEEADILRAAMGKKNKAQMERERARFLDGAKKNGVDAALGKSIFEKIETFASYGPDKSGRLVQIRTPDGQHFTVAGEDLAASYLFPKIVEALGEAGKNLDQCLTKQSKDER